MDENLRKLQLVELELFKKFCRVCEENNITYFALGGTLLGAVRHKGFIPWDDDIDIGIPKEDYMRFLEYCHTHEVPFEVQSFQYNENYYRYFAHIEDKSIKIVRKDKAVTEECYAWVDVFPLDGMPNNRILRSIWKTYILFRRAMYRYSAFSRVVDVNKKNRPLSEKILITIGKVIPFEKILDTRKELYKLDKALNRFAYSKSDYLVNAMGAYKFKEMFHKKYYGKGKDYPFEDTVVHGPIDYDTVCKQLYGDYMTPPPDAEKNHHCSEIISE